MSYFSRDFHFQQIPDKKYHIVSSVNDSALTNRFGTRSHNMFFVRHAANPKNLKFVTGIDGSMICSIKDDNYTLSEDMKKYLKNTLYESPAYDKLFFPKMLNDNIQHKQPKRNPIFKNLSRKAGIANSEIKDDIDKIPLLNKFVNNESGKNINQSIEAKNFKRSIKRRHERTKNDEKLDSKSVFWMEPSKTDEKKLQSNSLILPQLKSLRLNKSTESQKTRTESIVIKDIKIRNIDSVSESKIQSNFFKNKF